MKKCIFVVVIVLLFTLAACSNRNAPVNATGAQSESITMLDGGVWPENEYTAGLPVPPGTVSWATLDTEHRNCSINLVDISESDSKDYMELLKQEGFSVINGASEEIEGQDYVSVGTLLSNGEKGLSVSYIPNRFTIYISFLS